MICLLVSNQNAANATTTEEDLEKIVAQCLTVVASCDRLTGKQREEIAQIKLLNSSLSGRLSRTESELRKLENPGWLSQKTTWFVLGVIAGGLVYGKVTRP